MNSTYGVVVCGGKSTRMGRDKSLLEYHGQPQRNHVYGLLNHFCERTFLSVSSEQTDSSGGEILVDAPHYSSIGPMGALLTAFQLFPEKDFLLVGCDYPLLTLQELQSFCFFCEGAKYAAAFYREESNIYEPLLAWYAHTIYPTVRKLYDTQQYSLQELLHAVEADRYYPSSGAMMKSVDTPEEHDVLLSQLLKYSSAHSIDQ